MITNDIHLYGIAGLQEGGWWVIYCISCNNVWLVISPSEQAAPCYPIHRNHMISLKMQQEVEIDWQFDWQQANLLQWLALSMVSVPSPQTGI